MKIVRFELEGSQYWGEQLEGGSVARLSGDPFAGDVERRSDMVVVPERLLPPVVPAAIYGIGLNYREHAIESGMAIPEKPVVFSKLPSSVIGTDESIVLPRSVQCDEVDYECELAVVIGRSARNVSEADSLGYVLGYTCANDVSARDVQLSSPGGQWTRGKSYDTFCPLGPVLVTADEIDDPQDLRVSTTLNDRIVQDHSTNDMIFSVRALIAHLSEDTTLLPGTVILTGTPSGVGFARKPRISLQPGDTVEIEIERIGRLTNTVVAPQ